MLKCKMNTRPMFTIDKNRSIVVVVNRHMPWVGLSWGRCTPMDPKKER
jgi:hypothetical protein